MLFYLLPFCLLTINVAISATLPDFGNARSTCFPSQWEEQLAYEMRPTFLLLFSLNSFQDEEESC